METAAKTVLRNRFAPHRGGMIMALMIYMGGIYPAPHTALTLGVYALVVSVLYRSIQPLIALAVVGTTAFGFAAPKLLPIFDTMAPAAKAPIASVAHPVV